MSELEVKIRKYEKKDRDSVRKICCDTGMLGKPIDEVYIDRELFADMIIAPYLDIEPEHTFVAEHKNKVVGYLSGALNKEFETKRNPKILRTAGKMLWRSLKGNYNNHKRRAPTLTIDPYAYNQ